MCLTFTAGSGMQGAIYFLPTPTYGARGEVDLFWVLQKATIPPVCKNSVPLIFM